MNYFTVFFALAIAVSICLFLWNLKPVPKEDFRLNRVSFALLPEWYNDDVTEALPALKKSCKTILKYSSDKKISAFSKAGDWYLPCKALDEISGKNKKEMYDYLEKFFEPYQVTFKGNKNGTFTGYYEAEINGSFKAGGNYLYPVYGMPKDIVKFDLSDFADDVKSKKVVAQITKGKVVPYPTRAEIDGGYGISAPVLLWADNPVDIFITHIQGSARVKMKDGRTIRIGYAGNNGRKFVGIGSIMSRQGLLKSGKSGMPSIRKWLNENPKKANALMDKNPRYIFFRFIKGDGPIGAMGIPLTPERSMAVDRSYIPLGVPLWLNTTDPDGKPLNRLMVAQDVGSAIKGGVRGDFYWGSGEFAFNKAGRMKSKGQYYMFLPRKEQKQL
ncbi:MAG: MltA domain-containing protein [Alphaproteobacteria bacterium]|nr:MltA domain-containing protein [Alphaproteobacteria bacterium]